MIPKRIRRIAANPVDSGLRFAQRLGLARTPSVGEQILRQNSKFARKLGLRGIQIVMSYDCDTHQDAAAAVNLFNQLQDRSVPCAFAVPGEMLLRAADIYRPLSKRGATFLNHGARPHTEFSEGAYKAITFYNEMTDDEVLQDITEGHRIVCDVIGEPPRGFRAPHFGYFQQPHQRALIYSAARKLGYKFCSDTLPSAGYDRGPVFDVDGLVEIPLSGSLADPHAILDSWNYLSDRVNVELSADYLSLFAGTIDFFADKNLPAVLNYYVDPAHVVGSDIFIKAIDYAQSRGAKFISFDELITVSGHG